MNPLSAALSGLEAARERKCGACGTTLAHGARFATCRSCRVNGAVWRAVRKEAARNERLRRTIVAQKVYLGQTPPLPAKPTETILW